MENASAYKVTPLIVVPAETHARQENFVNQESVPAPAPALLHSVAVAVLILALTPLTVAPATTPAKVEKHVSTVHADAPVA